MREESVLALTYFERSKYLLAIATASAPESSRSHLPRNWVSSATSSSGRRLSELVLVVMVIFKRIACSLGCEYELKPINDCRLDLPGE